MSVRGIAVGLVARSENVKVVVGVVVEPEGGTTPDEGAPEVPGAADDDVPGGAEDVGDAEDAAS